MVMLWEIEIALTLTLRSCNNYSKLLDVPVSNSTLPSLDIIVVTIHFLMLLGVRDLILHL